MLEDKNIQRIVHHSIEEFKHNHTGQCTLGVNIWYNSTGVPMPILLSGTPWGKWNKGKKVCWSGNPRKEGDLADADPDEFQPSSSVSVPTGAHHNHGSGPAEGFAGVAAHKQL